MPIDPNSHEGRWQKRFALFPKRTREGTLVWFRFYYARIIEANWAGEEWEYAQYPDKPENIGVWRPYFAWLPIRFEKRPVTVESPGHCRWVWLRWVERRWIPTRWPQGLSSCFLPEDDYVFEYRY